MNREDLDAIRAMVAHQEHAYDCLPDPDRDPYIGCRCGETRTNRWRVEVRLLLAEVERLREARTQAVALADVMREQRNLAADNCDEAEAVRDRLRTELDEVGQRSADRMVENHRLSEALDAVRALADEWDEAGVQIRLTGSGAAWSIRAALDGTQTNGAKP